MVTGPQRCRSPWDDHGRAARAEPEREIETLGFGGVNDVRQGKFIEIELAETDPAKARESVKAMCEKLLANTVIERYRVEIG